MKKILILCTLCIILLAGTINAFDDCKQSEGCIGKFKRGSDITLYQTCNNCTYCNFTNIRNAENSSIWPIAEAIKNGSDFTAVIGAGNFTNAGIGEFFYNYNCGNDVDFDSKVLWFLITPFGKTISEAEAPLYVIILITTFLVFVFFLYFAITLPFGNIIHPDGSITEIAKEKYFKLLAIWFSIGFFMWFLQVLAGISNNFLTLDSLSNFITNALIYSSGLSFVFTTTILILLFIMAWKDIVWNKTIKAYGKAFIDGRLK